MKNGYHNIRSLITFCNLYDIISISKTNKFKDKITFSGKFYKGISKKSNTAIKVLNLLKTNKLIKNQSFKINIKKNIPQGSGLGGGSSNAANLLNYFNIKMKLKLNKKQLNMLANQIGSDVPISLEKKNTFLPGKKNQIIRIKKIFKFNLLIVYPNIICGTKNIYKRNKNMTYVKDRSIININNKKKMIHFLKKEKNDLENTVVRIYPKVGKVIEYIKSLNGCYFSRITGSGSACFGIFSNMKNAVYAKKLIKLKYPSYWCITSKTI